MHTGQILRYGVAVAAAVLLATAAQAGTFIAAKDGCQVWDPNPQLEETVTWSGACANGRAEGTGSVTWVKSGAEIETDEGEWHGGMQSGKGVQTWPGGRYEGDLANGEPNGRGVLTLKKLRYEGEFRDGRPNGNGSLTAGSDTVRGTWKDGCLQGPRKAAIGIPLSACR
jgi:hypothetical protein